MEGREADKVGKRGMSDDPDHARNPLDYGWHVEDITKPAAVRGDVYTHT
jgi:hypothetical protein